MKDKKDEKSKNFFDPFNSREEDVIVFVDPKKKEEWVNLDENVKKLTLSRLTECVKKVSNDMALDLLSHAINELAARIKKLEEDKMEKENEPRTYVLSEQLNTMTISSKSTECPEGI